MTTSGTSSIIEVACARKRYTPEGRSQPACERTGLDLPVDLSSWAQLHLCAFARDPFMSDGRRLTQPWQVSVSHRRALGRALGLAFDSCRLGKLMAVAVEIRRGFRFTRAWH